MSELFLQILQENCLSILIGILKCEWVVRSSRRIDAAMSKVIVAKDIKLLDFIIANKAQYENILPLTHQPSIKDAPGLFVKTPWRIILYALFHSVFNFVYNIRSPVLTIMFLL